MLLLVVYRLKAALRAWVMRDWLGSAVVLRAGSHATAAADSLAGLLGLEIAAAHEGSDMVAGLALDLFKCYGRLPLVLLREVADRAGVPRAPSGTMLHCYGMRRRVRADGLALGVVRGLAPGCPAATHWPALVARCWAHEVAARGAAPRDYVDDLVAVCRGGGRMSAVAAAWQVAWLRRHLWPPVVAG